jgi:hypothetical protein
VLLRFSALKVLYEQQSSALAQLTISEGASRVAERDLERTKELLALDKAHLGQELRAAETRAEQASKSAEVYLSKISALEIKNQVLADQLLNAQLNGSTGLESRMEKETSRIREEALAQIEQIKAASRDVIDRENKVLREAKEGAEAAQEQLKRSLDNQSAENVRLQTELIQLQARSASDAADMRAELKLKTFEIAVMGSTMEEKSRVHRQVEAELNAAKMEVSAHRQAFIRLEAESEVSLAESRTQLLAAKSRLAAYEALEVEIDDAVLRVAQAGQVGASDVESHRANDVLFKDKANMVDESASSALFSTLKNMPSHPERRARQAILLAQKVMESEKHIAELQSIITKLKLQLKENADVNEQADRTLKRVAQPTVYLVTKLRDEEMAHQVCREMLKSKNAELIRLQHVYNKLSADNNAIRERMHLVLQQRGEIDQLRGLLETLQSPEGNLVDDIREVNMGASVLPEEQNRDLSSFEELDGNVVSRASASGITLAKKVTAVHTEEEITSLESSSANSAQLNLPSHLRSRIVNTANPDQLARMTTSPTGADYDKGKWHTREDL